MAGPRGCQVCPTVNPLGIVVQIEPRPNRCLWREELWVDGRGGGRTRTMPHIDYQQSSDRAPAAQPET
jgi:hypothetical protein